MSTYQEVIDRVIKPSYWLDVLPEMHITEQPFRFDMDRTPNVVFDQEQIRREGYTHINSYLNSDILHRFRKGVDTLVQKGIAPLFFMLFDEFWELLSHIQPLVDEAFNEPFYLLPASWLWYLTPSENDKGWVPHRERSDSRVLREDGTPNSLSFWIPITPATSLNGCLYVYPVQYDTNYPSNLSEINLTHLQDIRAVPAEPGDVICFNHGIVHWGGRSSYFAKEPRISLAFEVQRQSLKPVLQVPVIDHTKGFDFFNRLELLLIQFFNYKRFKDYGEDFEDFMLELLDFLKIKVK